MKFFPRNLSLWCKKSSKWSWNLVLYDVFGTINWRVAIGTVPEAKISKSFPRVELHELDRYFFVDIGQPMCCLISKARLWITFTLYNKPPFITWRNLFYNENPKIYHPTTLAWQCKTNQIWRCISLLKVVIFHVVMLVFRGDIWKNPTLCGFRSKTSANVSRCRLVFGWVPPRHFNNVWRNENIWPPRLPS